MQLPSRTLTCLSAIAVAGVFQAGFSTSAAVPNILTKRTAIGISIADLYNAVKDYLAQQNAYDPDVPNKCTLNFGTFSGANCFMNVQCDETDQPGVDLPADNVCYLGGRQYFHMDQIGDFSVTYSKAGGVNGDTTDGLHSPVLQFASINNWEPLDLDAQIAQQGDSGGKLCTSGGLAADQELTWTCGIPTIGTALFGISNYEPVAQSTYAPGWCTMHVVQWQRNENGVGADYDFDVLVYDADQQEIGLVSKAAIDPTTKSLPVDSNLPYTIDITASGGDDDAVQFAYAGQSWDSNDRTNHQSNMGTGPDNGYENGKREGDMGFTC